MSISPQIRNTVNEDAGDTWINDMVLSGFGVSPLGATRDVVGSQNTSYDTSIGTTTLSGTQVPLNLNVDDQTQWQLYYPGLPQGDTITLEQSSFRTDRSRISSPIPLITRNESIPKLIDTKPEVGGQVAFSLLPEDDIGTNSTPCASVPSDLYFSSLDAAIDSIPPPNWHCPLNDPSVPTNDANRQTWVLRLVNAINNTTDVVDQRSAAFAKHWLSTPPFYHPAAIELLAWDICSLAEDMHTIGPIALQITDAKQIEQVRKTRNWTFAQRMLSIIALLMKCKSRCEKCMNKANVAMVVGNPEKLLNGSRGNQKQNGKRQVLLQAGRDMKKKRKLEHGVLGIEY